MFALNSPYAKGVIIADEVGLGKTIEAGIIMAQRWAERRRHLLLVVPAMLRTQWQSELAEKFYLPSRILDSKALKLLATESDTSPWMTEEAVVIASFEFIARNGEQVQAVPWDLIVVDEAHRLRNVYKSDRKNIHKIVDAIRPAQKLLLTATPLQNSLMELYGLVSVIDEHVFGDAKSFRQRYSHKDEEWSGLRDRLGTVCHRTLRSQVSEYISFTRRVPLTQDFTPRPQEQELYEGVSDYLARDELVALPRAQRQLITLVLRKLLSSSTFAIAQTLGRIRDRLKELRVSLDSIDRASLEDEPETVTDEDYDALSELSDELAAEPEDAPSVGKIDRELLNEEIELLENLTSLANSITENAKGEALVPALEMAFKKGQSLGAQRKAVIFTESRRTQRYLADLLAENGYKGKIVCLSGTNDDAVSRQIYADWVKRTPLEERSGSRMVDIKRALVEHFKGNGIILVATEAAAEGINLQFCSIVVNYDLPWNPARIEQRIGRCHRYGQKHDVVVLNFVNRANAADQRVFELLSQKFQLFEGVFGASDEVLGAIESGVDLEKRIAAVYQDCRTNEEIDTAFGQLQLDLDEKITTKLTDSRRQLLEHFDAEVSARLKMRAQETGQQYRLRQRWLLKLTQHELADAADFSIQDEVLCFCHADESYSIDWRYAEENGLVFFREEEALAKRLLANASERQLAPAHLTFRYDLRDGRIAGLEEHLGGQGWLALARVDIDSLDDEQHLVAFARMDDGSAIDPEIALRMLDLPATASECGESPSEIVTGLEQEVNKCMIGIEKRNAGYFEVEVAKLFNWEDDLKHSLEKQLKEFDTDLRDIEREARSAGSLEAKLSTQRKIREKKEQRNQKRQELYEQQDAIEIRRDELINDAESRLTMSQDVQELFKVRFTLSETG